METLNEDKLFRIVTIIILGLLAASTLYIIFRDAKNNPYTFKKLSYPEEIGIAKPGDILQVERVTKDSIYIGFKH